MASRKKLILANETCPFFIFWQVFEFWLLTHVALQNLPGDSDPSKCKWSSILGSLATNSMSFSSISIFDDDMTWSYDDVWNNNRFTIHWFSEKSISWSVDGVGLLIFEVSSARARSKPASSSTVEILPSQLSIQALANYADGLKNAKMTPGSSDVSWPTLIQKRLI